MGLLWLRSHIARRFELMNSPEISKHHDLDRFLTCLREKIVVMLRDSFRRGLKRRRFISG